MDMDDLVQQQAREDSEILTLMVCRLQNVGLLSEDELLAIENNEQIPEKKATIFDLLARNDISRVSKMLLHIRSIETLRNENSSKSVDAKNGVPVFPMQINTIINCVLGFLDLRDVKSCRLVSQKWNCVAEPVLKKRSKIIFCVAENEHDVIIRGPADFDLTFSSPSTTALPFTSFAFKFHYWPISVLSKFFEKHKKNIKELEFYDMMMIDEYRNKVECYDISHLIADSPVSKLDIRCIENIMSTKLSISIQHLQGVKNLTLERCKVNAENWSRISPVEIDLTNVTFCQNGDELTEYRLNDYIAFDKAGEIALTYDDFEINIPVLDLSECFTVQNLSLHGIRVINWARSKCIVNTLDMEDTPFMEKTEMRVKEMYFEDESMDLYAVPKDIEKLVLRGGEYICSHPIILPNLKSLYLKTSLPLLSHFSNCVNLVDLDICNLYYGDAEVQILDLRWIPQSVKRLKMAGCLRILGKSELDTLVLDSCTLSTTSQVLAKIKPKVLILKWKQDFELNDSVIMFLEYFRGLRFHVGYFEWDDCHFKTSRLAKYVDKKANYYTFENQRGKSMEPSEFSAMENF